MEAKKLALLCRDVADDKKAQDPVILDLRKVSSVADYFVIVTGTSEPHLRAIVDAMHDRLNTGHGIRARAVDGTWQAGWVVLDYSDVVVHVMRQQERERYDLEALWGDAPKMRARGIRPRTPSAAARKRKGPTAR
jgi:ribosome-associated protein